MAPTEPSEELVAARHEARGLEQEVREIASQMANVQAELAGRAAERGQLSTLIMAIERDLETRRSALDEKSRKRFEGDHKLALARDELSRLEAERLQAEKASAPTTIKIESFPTPLGKTVNGDEAYFRLKGGRLAVVPFQQLMERLQRSLPDIANDMRQSEVVDTIGPIEGFRLRYVIQRHYAAQGSVIQLAYAEMVPTSGQLGEPLDEALRPNSRFREMLDSLSPERYTITVWTYPDSFAEFRKLKRELYDQGYAVAARPLEEGMPIGASPHGSKSSAQ